MDWLRQSQDMFKNWMDSQKEMWDTWMDTTKDASSNLDVWKQSAQTWEHSIKNWLEMQALWMRMWVRNMAARSESKDAQRFSETVENMTKTWVSIQEQVWANWFAMMKELDPLDPRDTTRSQITEAIQMWQENMNTMLAAQTEWTQKWAEIMQSKRDE